MMHPFVPSFLIAALSLTTVSVAQVLLMPDSTNNRLVSFSPIDGSVINSNLFALQAGTPIGAIDVNGEIWVSEQIGDRVSRWSPSGTLLGNIGPTLPGSGLDNIRGLTLVGGIVYVTNSGTQNSAPGNAIVLLDTTGTYLTNFSTNGTAPSPFAVLEFQGNLLVASSSGNDDIHRYTLSGTPLGTFHNTTSLNFAQQMALASDGNVWCAGFSSNNVVKLDASTGAVLSSFAASGARGVFELANGNVMWTNGSGAHVFDISSQSSSLVYAGGGRHLNLYGAPSVPASTTAYGTGCDGLVIGANSLPTIGNSSFQLVVTNVPAVSPLALVAIGATALNPGLDLAAIGMPGCFGYNTLDFGLFGGSPVVSGTSSVPLPIPGNPALAGASLATQGVSFSLATPLQLASSNGLLVLLGF